MPGLDALPADQRTVLQLVLRQGRSYDAIARALRVDPAAVRDRAHAGLAGLVAPEGVAEGDRGRVADWLLGQHEDGAAALLARDGAARRWAAALRDELEPVATGGLPALPDAAPAAPDAPTAPGSGAAPRSAAATPSTTAAARPSSRRGGVVLLAALALFTVIVAVVVALVVSGGDSGGSGTSSAGTSASTSSSSSSSSSSGSTADARVLAQVNLTAPKRAPAPRALGVVQVVTLQGKQAINAIVQGLPAPTKSAGYGIWLVGDGGRKWLGYFRNADQQGRLVAQGQLDQRLDITTYRRLLVTRETAEPPKRPGTTYLAGAVTTGAAQGSGGRSTGSPGGSGGSGSG
jgi:hypothetical protein